MDFRRLRTFDLVASLMSFNRAAEALHCTQSTVSAQIKALEEDLGAPVFERLGRRIALTPAGQELQRHARRLLSYEHDIRAAVGRAGETVGLVSLRVPQSVAELYLPEILHRFRAAHPRVGFDISNCGYHHLPEELRTGQTDAGFLWAMALASADLCSTVVATEPLALIADPRSELAGRTGLTVRDLAGQTLLLARHDCAYRMGLQRDLVEARVDVAAMLELNSVAAVVNCLRAGGGISLLPERAVAAEIAAGRLVRLRWHEPLAADLFFIRHRDKPLTGAFGAFVTEVERYFAERGTEPAVAVPGRSPSPGLAAPRAPRRRRRSS
jgi:DNA-binding transcriptional LysR family regulator